MITYSIQTSRYRKPCNHADLPCNDGVGQSTVVAVIDTFAAVVVVMIAFVLDGTEVGPLLASAEGRKYSTSSTSMRVNAFLT